MADSTLDMTGEENPMTGLGHGTGALGPSDSSDSGSDVVGGPGMDEGLSDEQSRQMPMTTRSTAGRDVGDPGLEADSDRAGTGERGGSGIDGSRPNDTSLTLKPGVESGADEFDDPDAIDIEQVDGGARDVVSDPPDDEDEASVSDGAT